MQKYIVTSAENLQQYAIDIIYARVKFNYMPVLYNCLEYIFDKTFAHLITVEII